MNQRRRRGEGAINKPQKDCFNIDGRVVDKMFARPGWGCAQLIFQCSRHVDSLHSKQQLTEELQ